MKADGAVIYTVGVGSGTSTDELEAIASSPNLYYTSTSYSVLESIVDTLVDESCKGEKIYCSHSYIYKGT